MGIDVSLCNRSYCFFFFFFFSLFFLSGGKWFIDTGHRLTYTHTNKHAQESRSNKALKFKIWFCFVDL